MSAIEQPAAGFGRITCLVRPAEDVGALGHEMDAAEDDVVGLRTRRRELRQLERVAARVGVLDDLVALVVVAEDHQPLAQRRPRRARCAGPARRRPSARIRAGWRRRVRRPRGADDACARLPASRSRHSTSEGRMRGSRLSSQTRHRLRRLAIFGRWSSLSTSYARMRRSRTRSRTPAKHRSWARSGSARPARSGQRRSRPRPPVARVGADIARRLDDDARRAARESASTARAAAPAVMLSSRIASAPASIASRTCCLVLALDLDFAAGARHARAPVSIAGVRPPAAAIWLSLIRMPSSSPAR